MPMTDLYLIRHGESEWNASGRWQGQADPPLSPRGRDQVRALADHFPAVNVTHVLSSDLQRAHGTAVPFAERFGLKVQVVPELRELDVGSWSGRTREEIAAAEPGALDRYFAGEVGWTGGETFDEHEARSADVAVRLATIDTDGVVVAVTHGGTLRAILRTLLDIPHEERWRISGPGFTALTHLRNSPHGWRLVSFNATLRVEEA
jgi:broad specificity phosphatase PhoE